jgi:Methyltransferase FkbM domain
MSTLDHTLTAALDELGRAGRSAFLVSIGVGGRFTTPSALRYLNNSDCSGLIIEAEPVLFERLRTGAGARPHVHLEHVAVAADDGEMELLTIPPRAFEAGGAPPVLVGLASQIPVRAAAHSASYRAMADKWGRLVRVPALSVETLLTRYQVRHIDLLQIDAAGYEWPIFNQFDLEQFRPAVVRIAWSYTPPADRIRMVRRLERLGYDVDSTRGELIALIPQAAPTDQAPSQASEGDIVLYAITYNAPGQLERWLTSMQAHAPDMLRLRRKFLLDNSTLPGTRDAYDALASRYGFTVLREGNLGITGGRYFCARHFHALTGAWALLWFEDDMMMAGPAPSVCRNGFATHVPALLDRATTIVIKEDLDYLKLSFTEFYGDHHLNWAWYNVPAATRRQEFPDGDFRTRIAYTGAENGVSYVIGELHYSNWPVLMTRRGNERLFVAKGEPLYEQHSMADAFTLMRAGELRAGALLASPILHDRTFHYPADERREF